MGTEYPFEPLQRKHNRKDFSCGEAALDQYLKAQASQDQRRNVSSVFVATQKQSTVIVAFYTLCATSVPLGDFPGETQSKLPRYPEIPGILLGRLAVDNRMQGQGLGRLALADALERAASTRRSVGAAFVIVEAKHAKARAFYQGFGFKPFFDDPLRLYIAMNTIEKALAAVRPRDG